MHDTDRIAGQGSPPKALRWVSQGDPGGCGPACLAMLTGRTYAEARDLIDGMWDEPKKWAASAGGSNEFDLDRALAADGYFTQRRYSSWAEKGTTARLSFPEPFAPVHYCMVLQPSNNYHFVVMRHDGEVLDPLREGSYRLSDWPKVAQVVGVVRPLTQVYMDVAKAASRYVEVQPEGIAALTEDAHFGLLRAVTNWRDAA